MDAISCTGENLYPYQGNYSKKFLSARFEKYGTRESGIIACECQYITGCTFYRGVYLEFIKDSRQALPGEMGDNCN